jgi:hypothetical protein
MAMVPGYNTFASMGGIGMNFREMNLRIFQGKPVPHVFFQPRFEPWYDWHRTFNTLPERYCGLSLLNLYDQMQVSMRTVHYYTGMPDPVVRTFLPPAIVREQQDGLQGTIVYETPYGDLVEKIKRTQDETWRTVGFPVKLPEDFKKLRWLVQHMEYAFSPENFDLGSDYIGERGQPGFWVPKSPYQALAQWWMRLEDLIYALADCRAEVEETMRVIDESYDRLYEQLGHSAQTTRSGGVKIINFGENLHEALMGPRYFERYFFPFYEKRCAQLHQAGIYSHVHLDGYFHSLLKYLRDLPFDGLEALTPTPQGDVTLEEMKEHIGDKILLDGIPAVYFLPMYSREELMACVEKVVEYFAPRLILGVSDEVPEGADEEAMIRVKMVSDWCLSHKNG